MIVVMFLLLLLSIAFAVYVIIRKQKTEKSKKCINEKTQEEIKKFLEDNPNSLSMTQEQFKNIKDISGDENSALLQISIALADTNNNVPISNYYVGACVLGQSGTVYFGKNFEFSTPMLVQTLHGEQTAIHNAAYHKEPKIVKLAVNAAPCGSCRQYLIELGPPEDLTVIFCSGDVQDDKSKIIVNTLQKLLPDNFGPLNLNDPPVPFALDHDDWKVETSDSNKSIEMLKQSYAPYTKLPSGISVTLSNNKEFGGQTIENAAYNPSITSVRGLLSLLNVANIDLNDITRLNLSQGYTEGDEQKARNLIEHQFIPLIESILPSNVQYEVKYFKVS